MTKAPKKGSSAKKTTETITQPDYQLHMPFPHRVLQRDWQGTEKMNAGLKEQIWRERALDPDGLYRSNMAGTWHSKDGILERLNSPESHQIKQMFGQAFSTWAKQHGAVADGDLSMRMSGWAMLYSDRGYAAVHTHPNCHASAVYYVDNTAEGVEKIMATGVRVRSGDIEFYNPSPREFQVPFMRLQESFIVPYETGRMLVFPSYLNHMVHPMQGAGERISIAMNCTFIMPRKDKP